MILKHTLAKLRLFIGAAALIIAPLMAIAPKAWSMYTQTADPSCMKILTRAVQQKNLKSVGPLFVLKASQGDVASVRAFLNAGVDVNIRDYVGETALLRSVQAGQLEMTQLLLHAGAQTQVRSTKGKALLDLAVEKQDLEMIALLSDMGLEHSQGPSALDSLIANATNKGDVEAVQQLIAGGADIYQQDNEGNTLLMQMATDQRAKIHKQLEAAKDRLIFSHKEPQDIDSAALKMMQNQFNRRAVIARLLIQAGIDINHQNHLGNTALMLAIKERNMALPSMLIDAGADVNLKNHAGESALLWAAVAHFQDAVKSLMAAGFNDIEHHIETKGTALVRAVPKERVRTIRTLIKLGANVNARRSDTGDTALILAARGARIETARLLLDAGADINATNLKGETAVISAAYNVDGSSHCLPLLIQHGADLNTQNHEGMTALMIAASVGQYRALLQLLHAGADLSLKNKDGLTVTDILLNSPQPKSADYAQAQLVLRELYLRTHGLTQP